MSFTRSNTKLYHKVAIVLFEGIWFITVNLMLYSQIFKNQTKQADDAKYLQISMWIAHKCYFDVIHNLKLYVYMWTTGFKIVCKSF